MSGKILRKIWETILGYLFLSPVIIVKTMFTFLPFIFVIYMSFFAVGATNITKPSEWDYRGLYNYVYFLVPRSSRVYTGSVTLEGNWVDDKILLTGKVGDKDVKIELKTDTPVDSERKITFEGSIKDKDPNFGGINARLDIEPFDGIPTTSFSGTITAGSHVYVVDHQKSKITSRGLLLFVANREPDIKINLTGKVGKLLVGGVNIPSGSPEFYTSLRFTVTYVLVEVPILLTVALFVAILLWGKLKYLDLYRTGIFFSYVTPAVATAMMWKAMFYRDGFFNQVLQKLHLPYASVGGVPIAWYQVMPWAFYTIVIYSVWKGLGFNSLIFLAGLINIPEELMEAARVDGATEWQVFRYVVLPLLSPTAFFLIMINLIGAFKIFSPILVLTQGGPNDQTLSMVYLVYRLGFQDFTFGKAAAVSVVLFVIIFVVSLLQKYLGEKVVFYAGKKG